jgi:hypothetical protein
MNAISRLPASAVTVTPVEVLAWAERAVAAAKEALEGATPLVRLWPYRHGSCEYLCCDVTNAANDAAYGITFVVDGCTDWEYAYEPHVPDMPEALHMAGIVIAALNATVTVGRRGADVEEAVRQFGR